jgi:hypothetical protein
MAGWGAYTTALVNTKNVSYGAIVGADGATWANSHAADFKINVRISTLLKLVFSFVACYYVSYHVIRLCYMINII